MSVDGQALGALREQLGGIVQGTIFLFMGLAACSVAAILRGRRGIRLFVWLGIWSAIYGVQRLARTQTVVAALPHWFQIAVPYIQVVIAYLMAVVAWVAWAELSVGKMRVFLRALIVAGLAIGLAGIGWFAVNGVSNTLLPYTNLLVTASLIVLVTVVAAPKLSARYLVLPDRGVLAVGSLVFAGEALLVNLARPLQIHLPGVLDSLGFASLLFSFGYVAVRIAVTNERRLLSIDKELEIARELQLSTLPESIPELLGLRIAAVYEPMTAVAGDFYDFLPVDDYRIGLLVADVSGHGVPAALGAAMIKTAMQSVASCAHDPREMLSGLDRILSGQLQGQLVTAAYLWIDTQAGLALYSAAGHPPLLRCRAGKMERIDSNGLIFGVMPGSDYPVRTLPISSGDRFLLYTDGLIEAVNTEGDFFGDWRLAEVMRIHANSTPAELSLRLLAELRDWHPASINQNDDITIIVVDVL
jgi:phosphoserine phosphatase RsbU/P